MYNWLGIKRLKPWFYILIQEQRYDNVEFWKLLF